MRKLSSCFRLVLSICLVFGLVGPGVAAAAPVPTRILLGADSAAFQGRALGVPSIGALSSLQAVTLSRPTHRPHIESLPRPGAMTSSPLRLSVAGMRTQSLATLTVDSSAIYSDSVWMWADGLITNHGTDAVTSVTVTAVFVDALGNELGREGIVPQVDVLDGGASAAFTWAFPWWQTAPPAGTASYRFEASGVTAPGTSAVLLSVQHLGTTVDTHGMRHYNVRVTNNHPDDVTGTVVTGYERLLADGSFVDATGNTVGRSLRLTPGAYVDVDLPGGAPVVGALDEPVLRAEAHYAKLAPGLNMYEPSRSCSYDGTATVDGRILDENLAAVESTAVTARTSVDGGRTWRALAPTGTDETGRFAFQLKPVCATLVSVSSAGTTVAVVTANRFAALSEPQQIANAAAGRAFAVRGTLKPRHTAGTKAVKIETAFIDSNFIQSPGPTFWATASTYSSYSKYAASVTFKKKGLWALRASVPGDSLHLATTTTWHYVWVGDTTLSLKTSRSKVSFAKSATLSATLKDATKHGIAGRRVTFQIVDAISGSSTKTVRTNSAGVAKLTVKPQMGAGYGVSFAGDSATWQSESGAVTVSSDAWGGTFTGSGYTGSVKLGAGLHQVVMYNNTYSYAYFGVVNGALTKVIHRWYAPARKRTAGAFRLSGAGTYRLAATTSDSTPFVMFVW